MQFKNSLSIFSTNLSLSYKVLILFIVVIIIASAIFVSIFNPLVKGIVEALKLEGIDFSLSNFIENPVPQIKTVWNIITGFLNNNYGLLISRILYLCLLLVFARFFISIALLPISKFIYNKMTTGYSEGLFSSLVANLSQSLGYALITSIVFTIIDIATGIITLYSFIFLYSLINVSAFLPGFVIFLTLYSARITLFSQWLSVICDGQKNILKAFVKGFKLSLKCFSVHYPMCLTVTIIYATVLTTSTFSTFGLLPILLYPMYIILVCIFNLTSYFNLKNRKYYTDEGITVYTPK